MDWKTTRLNIRLDFRRSMELMTFPRSFKGVLFLMVYPPVLALVIYRVSHYFYAKGMHSMAWFLYVFNLYLTGADITPSSEIGESAFVGHLCGLVVAGKIGRGVMLMGQCGVGGGMDIKDIGAGPGLPVVGDNVVIGWRASILGAVRVGDGAVIAACALVTRDVLPGVTVAGAPARPVKGHRNKTDYDSVADSSRHE